MTHGGRGGVSPGSPHTRFVCAALGVIRRWDCHRFGCLADLHHFDDPAVAAVAPRVVPSPPVSSLLERYEASRSSLDMGRHPELVRPRSRLGFVPSAALIVRREALGASGFDQDLRLGEDVDLVWRLAEAGWHVRYDPTVTVSHETRARPSQWLRRRYDYGTSAAALERRHPGNLAPARVSAWNLATLGLVAARRPVAAASVSAAATAALALRTRSLPRGPQLAGRVVLHGFVADGASIGHLLRREWWPIGCAAMLLSPRSRTARTLVACMLGPIAWEWMTTETRLDPVRYTALRLLDDAAYGTGVIASSVTSRVAAPWSRGYASRRLGTHVRDCPVSRGGPRPVLRTAVSS